MQNCYNNTVNTGLFTALYKYLKMLCCNFNSPFVHTKQLYNMDRMWKSTDEEYLYISVLTQDSKLELTNLRAGF